MPPSPPTPISLFGVGSVVPNGGVVGDKTLCTVFTKVIGVVQHSTRQSEATMGGLPSLNLGIVGGSSDPLLLVGGSGVPLPVGRTTTSGAYYY